MVSGGVGGTAQVALGGLADGGGREGVHEADTVGDLVGGQATPAQEGEDLGEDIPKLKYRSYACSLGAEVMYKVAGSDEAKKEVYDFALSETSEEFEPSNPVVSLALAASEADDAEFCGIILDNLENEDKFNELRKQATLEDASQRTEGYELYLEIIDLLEEAANE